MNDLFQVAIHYDRDNGFIEYDCVSKQIKVQLEDEAKRREVEAYLSTTQIIRAAQHTLVDFTEWQAVPNEDVRTLQLALARLWETTGVHVDWSRPVA